VLNQPSGLGLGFRYPHASTILSELPDVPWFELIADELLCSAGRRSTAEKLRRDYPCALHAVGMNIAGADPLDQEYLLQLREQVNQLEAGWLSDHLCWSANGKRQHFDLLPLPFSERQLKYVAARVEHVQEVIGRPLVLENISYYVRFEEDDMSEWEFHAQLCKLTGCEVLLDLNNLWSNALNFSRNPADDLDHALRNLPAESIRQIHLAGASCQEGETPYWIDTHGEAVPDAVVELYVETMRHLPDIPTIIERDNSLPEFQVMEQERQQLLHWARSEES